MRRFKPFFWLQAIKKEAQLCHHADYRLAIKCKQIFDTLGADKLFASGSEDQRWMFAGTAMYRAGQLAMYKKMRARRRKAPVLREVKSA